MTHKLVLLAAATAVCALAQQAGSSNTIHIVQGAPARAGLTTVTSDQVFVMGAPGPMPAMERVSLTPMKGAPYSADAVTESVQILADGNRITNKQTTKQYRDSEGRTRTETTIGASALWVPQDKNATFITIMDPVSGESFTLNSGEKMATKMAMPKRLTVTGRKAEMHTESGKTYQIELDGAPGAAGVTGVMTAGVAAEGPAVVTFQRRSPMAAVAGDQNFKTEELGKQVIEGVECLGVRETVTIPAGQIGNDRPIEIVTERWGSPDLGVDVLRKHTDPRSGETTYRLTNLIRGEQPRSLFEVPADYKVNDFSADAMRKKMTIKVRDTPLENQ